MPHRLDTDPIVRARVAQGGGIHRIVPRAVARPATASALREALEAAATAGLPVTPRGAGSAMGGGSIGAGVVLDLRDYEAGRCIVEPAARRAHLTPSLTLAALQGAAHPFGLHFPVDPSSARWVTLGGMVGTNAAGARTVHDGPTRAWVEALALETTDGPLALARGAAPDPHHPVVRRLAADALPRLARDREAILARWPRTRKNTLGYALDAWYASGDLLDLVVGAEGTLGVVTDLTLRLAPLAAHAATVRAVLAERAALPDATARCRDAGAVRVEFLDRSFLAVVHGDPAPPAAILLVDLEDDDPDRLAARVAALAAALRAHGATAETALAAADAHALWAVRHGASPRLAALGPGRRSLQVVEDGCVPPPRFAAYLDAVEAACAAAAMPWVGFGHAGDGHVHVNLLPDVRGEAWLPRVRQVHDAVLDAIIRLGGTPAGEHGAGRLRAPVVERVLGPEAVAAFRAIKAAFDPDGRWNPGVIIPDGTDPFTHLKVGPEAAALPEGMAAAWDQVEAEGRWGEW